MILAEVDLGDLIWTTIWIFFLAMFIWLFVAVVSDLIRDHSLSGWAKAGWVVGLILFPLIGSLVYLIARGEGMAHREAAREQAAQAQFASYVRNVATSGGGSQVDDLARLEDLRRSGTITDAEMESIKARMTSGTTSTP